MKLPPAVIVHGLGMAQAALAQAAGRPITLVSGEGAAAYAGVAWWQALVAEAAAGTGADAPVRHVLDCGIAPARALEALRAGQILLVLRANPLVLQDIGRRAAGMGAILLPRAPPSLDLADRRAWRRLKSWLGDGPDVA